MELFNSGIPNPPFKNPNAEEYNCEFNNELNVFEINIPNGKLIYAEHYFDKKHGVRIDIQFETKDPTPIEEDDE